MFKNAYEGIKKIYISELLMLIASIVTFVGAIVTLTSITSFGASTTNLTILGVIVIVFAIVSLIAFILNIVGLAKARKDESNFNTAYVLTFAGIIASVLSSIFRNNKDLSDIFSIAIDLIWLLVTCLIIVAIVNIAKQVNDPAVAAKGNNLLKLIVGVQVLAIVIKVVSIICAIVKIGQTIPAVLSIIAGVLTVVYHLIYISLLSKANKMLA